MQAGVILYITIIFIVILSFPAVIWFFRFRKMMIRRQSQLAAYLEEEFNPRDKIYWLLGYLVGFRARYTIKRGLIDNVHLLYITPPYHVFFYLPIISLFKKKERLDVIIKFKEGVKMGGIAHIADLSIKTIRMTLNKDLGEKTRYNKTIMYIDKKKYTVYYTNTKSLEIAKKIIQRASQHAKIYRVTVDGTSRTIMISFEPGKIEEVRKVLSTIWGLIPELRETTAGNKS